MWGLQTDRLDFMCASLEKEKAHFYVDFGKGEYFSQVIFLTAQRQYSISFISNNNNIFTLNSNYKNEILEKHPHEILISFHS